MNSKITGLTSKQVITNRDKYGMNQMPRPKLKTVWNFLGEVFTDKLNVVLLIMALIFLVLGLVGYGSISEAIGIGVVLVVVAVTTVCTKLKSQRSAEELYQKSSMQTVTVIRNAKAVQIDSTMVVYDDIVVLRSGEKICADGYIIYGEVEVNNSILNGESTEVKKTAVTGKYIYNPDTPVTSDDYTDDHSVFAGTTVLSGKGYMRVTRIGANTENAKIMSSLYSINELKTTLQIQLDNMATLISKLGSVCALIIFAVLLTVNLYATDFVLDANFIYTVFSSLTVALTIFVAAVPEGLPFIIGIITSQNVNRMIKANILAKNPHKIPEAGNIQLLCTDKTGTLTKGFLQPVHNFSGSGTDIGFGQNNKDKIKEHFFTNIALTCDCTFDARNSIVGGNMTCRALFLAVKKISKYIISLQQKNPVADRVVFDSSRKFSAAKVSGKKSVCYYMGAPEIILAHAVSYVDSDGKVQPLDKEKMHALIKQNAKQAMRLVATAFSPSWVKKGDMPKDLIFVSMVAMRDQVRAGVNGVISAMSKSGVQVMMITGDILETAHAIALDCGIMETDSDIAITASEFDKMSDEQVKGILHNIKVIARATPSTKLRLVKLAQSVGLCIGMCGDGTNDAPALKRADVGFAMGDGTDVCKESSDIIITDNNFLSIANCILLGRTFVHNVVNFLKFQLPINFTLVVLSILFPILFGLDAFTAVQILLVNIVMDSLNSLAFGGEAPRKEYLQERTYGKNAPLLNKSALGQIIWTTFGFCGVFALLELLHSNGLFVTEDAYMSARFALLIIMAVVNGFCVRARGCNIFAGLSQNPMFMVVALGIVVCTVLSVWFGGQFLQLVPLSLTQWLIVFGLSVLIIPINFIRYLALRRKM
ncbi:MAG: cation-transporting P-type ATPase [Alphaproteobacteria bacterium]|nr:cation-transporting P-type ATPase [Alphaproteobacteria bacterium]